MFTFCIIPFIQLVNGMMRKRSHILLLIIGAASFVTWFSLHNTSSVSQAASPWFAERLLSMRQVPKAPISIKSTTNNSHWIVVTSVQLPTEDVKNLAEQEGWAVVVVADKKTPLNWEHPGVHFLSIEAQEQFGAFAKLLPYASYTRKNLGYLYALMNGAKWIYDTDDDNKPYGLGLRQFDYSDKVSGLRYIPIAKNLSEQLFNPYQFYGFQKMWPRGFPLEYIRGHTNGKNRLILCRKIRTAAVQQGLVHHDPDVDAVYRLLYASKESGLNVAFNKFAPPVTLEAGTYSPWNSQNTLFHYRAFFAMFLPTTVAFRVTDIWRSFFAQKLLHLIGEEIAFYPVNAVQFRNAHNYLKDFDEELDVYEKSGLILQFLDGWSCSSKTIDICTIELAKAFVFVFFVPLYPTHHRVNNFWAEQDKTLIEVWIQTLREMKYEFPPLKKDMQEREYKVNLTEKYSDCREANIDLGTGEYNPDSDQVLDISRAEQAVTSMTELLNWCGDSRDIMNDTILPLPEDFANNFNNGTLKVRLDQVLVLINNYPWNKAVGLLQRMYAPYFGLTIFCGTWDQEAFRNESLKLIEPVNFINMSRAEMKNGVFYHYCISKVRDLRLQNVKGYFYVADDSIFNFWYDIPENEISLPVKIDYWSKMYWKKEYGENFLELINTKYKDEEEIQASWREFEERLKKFVPNVTVEDHMTSFTGKVVVDFLYLPTSYMPYFANIIEPLVQSGMMVENAMPKIFHTVEIDNWAGDRGWAFRDYRSSILGTHPLKLGFMEFHLNQRERFCENVISRFVKEIFE